MEELIQTISEKAGITVDQAKTAIETVLAHFKDKLPMGIGEKLESFLQSGATSAEEGATKSTDFLSGLKEKLEGLF
jgi:nucleoid DNA-binding protein